MLDVGRQLTFQVRRWLRGRDLVLVGDSGLSALLFLDAMRRGGITAVTRLRLDAALYEPAPPRPPGTIGRLRTKGARLPTLAATLAAKDTRWHAVVVPGWYGAGERTLEIASGTAVWRHGGLPVVPIRWVLVRDPESRFAPQALLCTDLDREPVQIVSWFVQRWSVEVTFQEARAHLGMETQRQLRKSMVELAWLWLRYQPGSGFARWFVERVGTGRGRIRKITAVALARKLLVALWRYLATGLVPEGARLKAA